EPQDDDATQTGLEVLTQQGLTKPRGTATAWARLVKVGATVSIVASDSYGSIDVLRNESYTTRQLVLDERANPGFHAYLDGKELDATVTDQEWVQAFELPETGGKLTVEYAPAAGSWLWWIPGVLAIITLLLGIPAPARRTTRRGHD